MSSMPREVLEDVMRPLDRWTLDDVQFTSRRFLQLILQHMSGVCLREIDYATFRAPNENEAESSYTIRIDGRPDRAISKAHKDAAQMFSEFLQALRSSHTLTLTLSRLSFTPELAALVIQTPITADDLRLEWGSCAELTRSQFQGIVVHLSPAFVDFTTCHLRACQVTDELVRALIKQPIVPLMRMSFPYIAPVDGGSFCVTVNAIVEFFMQEDVEVAQEGNDPLVYLHLRNGNFTKGLFKHVAEASSVSTRTQPLRIMVSPWRIEDEDLRDFADHLSYRYRGTPGELRVYDFPAEQRGASAAMHLQIVLFPSNMLGIYRARRPSRGFLESDE